MPKGCVGELILAGCQLAREYLYEADKTSAKFVEHPIFGRTYHTGDLARQLADQSIEYLGRSDDQVKIHGIRIELLEINAAIKTALEEVLDSETMAMELEGGDGAQQIVNFSVASHGDPLPSSQELVRTDEAAAEIARKLRQTASLTLPSYMVPSLFVILRRFPRTSSAKIDRVALKQAMGGLDIQAWEESITGISEEAWEETEEASAVKAAIAKLCRVDAKRIGPSTPLQSVGLDSMRAIALARELAKQSIHISAVDIIQLGSIRLIAEQVAAGSSSITGIASIEESLDRYEETYRPEVCRVLKCTAADIAAILPASITQVGMIAETLRDPSAYWIRRVFKLPRDVDEKKLRSAIEKTVATADVLRTCFLAAGELADVDEGDAHIER